MNITSAAKHVTRPGTANYFTGTVWLDEIPTPASETPVRMLRVTFEPGARTAWHTHPHGQTLHILAGAGRVQTAGEGIREVFPGDTVWIAPGERHWHGAAPDRTMVHLAVQMADASGSAASWQEQVSDADYGR